MVTDESVTVPLLAISSDSKWIAVTVNKSIHVISLASLKVELQKRLHRFGLTILQVTDTLPGLEAQHTAITFLPAPRASVLAVAVTDRAVC